MTGKKISHLFLFFIIEDSYVAQITSAPNHLSPSAHLSWGRGVYCCFFTLLHVQTERYLKTFENVGFKFPRKSRGDKNDPAKIKPRVFSTKAQFAFSFSSSRLTHLADGPFEQHCSTSKPVEGRETWRGPQSQLAILSLALGTSGLLFT